MAEDFDLTDRRLVWIPVTWAVMQSIGDALAEPVERTVELQIDLVDLDEFGRLFVSPLDENGDPKPDAVPPATPERVQEWKGINDTVRALAIVNDWRKVKSGGRVIPYSEDAMAKLMRVPGFAAALFLDAFPKAYAAVKETRQGNLPSLPEGGQENAAPE